MVISDTTSPIIEQRGRESKYPFRNIGAGQTLTIENVSDKQVASIRSAFYQFKKYNRLNWVTRVSVIGSNIYIHRIS